MRFRPAFAARLAEAGNALVGVRTARNEVTAERTQAQTLRRALYLAELRYQSGVASYLEVLEAQRELRRSSH
jgi:multidrug efflux system outer membrane protein